MTLNRNRTGVAAAACAIAIALATVGAGCSSTDETVSSQGAPGSGRPGTTGSSGSAVTTRTVPPGNAGSPIPPTSAQDEAPTSSPQLSIPETTIADPDTTLAPPEPTVVPTIPATVDDPALIDCGVVYRASGWPTTFPANPTYFSCLADAFAAGTPARLVDREQTDGFGGAILITTYDVLGPGALRMTVDATSAADRPQVVTVSACTGVVADMMDLVVSGCTAIG